MTMEHKPHSGPYLAAEGATWVTMAHYEELLAERDRLEEQLKNAQNELARERSRPGGSFDQWDDYQRLVEQLEAFQELQV